MRVERKLTFFTSAHQTSDSFEEHARKHLATLKCGHYVLKHIMKGGFVNNAHLLV
jgi:hypothetical protein